VLIVEDIVDSGLTLRYLLSTPVRYTGFEIPNGFVIGYGLDYRQLYRGLPYVATLVNQAS